ncbi:MAG: hypothetical protein JWQ20_2669 [Conexibacter sp.]|nr:hypothetical protein [Conexibacter sp.]
MTDWDPEAGARARAALQQAGGVVSVQQLATEWGMSRQAVDKRTRADGFPEPFAVVSSVRIYLRCEVDLRDRERKS